MPTMTFAATAEVVRYLGAHPDAGRLRPGRRSTWTSTTPRASSRPLRRGTLGARDPGGSARRRDHPGARRRADARHGRESRASPPTHGLWVVEDAAHAFPAAWRPSADAPWQRCGEQTAAVTCFSFYANKTITTGEGGMATTDDADLAERMRLMSLHGLSHDAWGRYSGGGKWDYRIVAPGLQVQPDRRRRGDRHPPARPRRGDAPASGRPIAQRLLRGPRGGRGARAAADGRRTASTPGTSFRSACVSTSLAIDRNAFMDELKAPGVGCSVHWRPLHLHPYYEETFGWKSEDLPVATRVWERLDQPADLSGDAGGRDRARRRRPFAVAVPPAARRPTAEPRRGPEPSGAGGRVSRGRSRSRSRPRASSSRRRCSCCRRAWSSLDVRLSRSLSAGARGAAAARRSRSSSCGPCGLRRRTPGHGAAATSASRRSADSCAGRSSTSCPSSGTSCAATCRSSVRGRRSHARGTRGPALEGGAARSAGAHRSGHTESAGRGSLLAGVEGDRERYYRETLQPVKLAGYVEYLRPKDLEE